MRFLIMNSKLGPILHQASKSSKVNDFHVIWKGVCHFLLAINSKLGPISHHFRDTATSSLKLSIKNCGQTTEMDTWLLLTAYKKFPQYWTIGILLW